MFADFIGNEKAVNLVSIGIQAAIRKNDKLPDYIFSGASGNGKTKLAKYIVKEVDAVSVYLNASTLSNTESIVATLDSLIQKYNTKKARYAVVIVDEAHSLKSGKICDFFLTAISEHTVDVKSGRTTQAMKIQRECSCKNDFLSWIFITNRAGELADALLSRLTEVRFIDYTIEEKAEISKRHLKSIGAETEDDIFIEIAKRSWSARDVIKYSEGVNDYSICEDLCEKISLSHTNDYFELIGIDERGLGSSEREYINIIKLFPNGISLQNIASKLGIGVKDVSEMIEKKLIRLNIVNIESSGRTLVSTGEAINRFSV